MTLYKLTYHNHEVTTERIDCYKGTNAFISDNLTVPANALDRLYINGNDYYIYSRFRDPHFLISQICAYLERKADKLAKQNTKVTSEIDWIRQVLNK